MFKKKRISLNQSQLTELETLIGKMETKTNGEIVLANVARSHHYLWVFAVLGLLGWAVGSGILAFTPLEWGQWSSLLEIFLFQLACISILASFGGFAVVIRSVVPRRWLAERVHHQAITQFMTLGLTETKDRTGVLIYISELEHRVEILADKGINDKVSDHYWEKHVETLTQGIKSNTHFETLKTVISDIGKHLEESFPATGQNPDELSNKVITQRHVFQKR